MRPTASSSCPLECPLHPLLYCESHPHLTGSQEVIWRLRPKGGFCYHLHIFCTFCQKGAGNHTYLHEKRKACASFAKMAGGLAFAGKLFLFPAQFETVFFFNRSADHLIDVTVINTITSISSQSTELRIFAF